MESMEKNYGKDTVSVLNFRLIFLEKSLLTTARTPSVINYL